MKTRKIFALLLSVCMLLSIFTVFTMTVNAEDSSLEEKYAELAEARRSYIKEYYDVPGHMYGIYGSYSSLTVLLYTDLAKEWTYEKVNIDVVNDSLNGPTEFMFHGWRFYIKCTEVEKAVKTTTKLNRSKLRACIQYFGISKEELILANKKMQEDPDSVLEYLPELSDEELNAARYEHNGLFIEHAIPDFMIEMLYLEDDLAASNLLSHPDVLLLEDGIATSAVGLGKGAEYYHMTPEELAEYDLKPVWVEDFLEEALNYTYIIERNVTFLKSEREYQLANPDVPKNGLKFSVDVSWYYKLVPTLKTYDLTPPEVEEFLNDPRVIAKFGEKNIAELKAEREKQLKNPSTGEEVYLIPVALVSLALGALVIYPRRRKIDNI